VAKRDDIVAFADELLDVGAFRDYGPVGMQVVGADEVTKIVCAVSASRELFERAAAAGAQMVLVHHGVLWENEPRTIDRRMKGRLQALFAADLTLLAYHLALDAHLEVGNNVLLARELGVDVDRAFVAIGVGGSFPAGGVSIDELAARVERVVGRTPLFFADGPARIERAAVVTGGGARYLADAAVEGYHVLVTGEATEPTMMNARELAMHFVAAGHYATERLGVQALAARIAERFRVEWEFVELENPV
jgi:dinuclear metal center YbgI/SA1388 family protein